MDNNDSNIKSQQTGGLKLMTVFIAVLALHVVVIGGFTVYHLMSGGNTDADIVTLDKAHLKADGSMAVTGTVPDATTSDKPTTSTPTPAPATDVATTTPATSPAPVTTDVTAANEVVPPTPSPAPILTPVPVPSAPLATTPPPVVMGPSNAFANNAQLAPLAPTASQLAPLASEAAAALAPAAETATVPAVAASPAPALTPAPAITSAPVLTPVPVAAAPAITPAVAPALSPAVASGPVHMPPASAAPSPSHVEGQGIYTVKITDSYKKIAKAHHVTVAQLKEVNHIKGDVLHTGQKLMIPAASKTLIAKAESTSMEATPSTSVLSQSPAVHTAVLTTSTTSEATSSHSHMYTIEKGDTLSKIAHKFKTTTTAIMNENSNLDPTKLTIGKKLKIPSRESRSAGTNVPPRAQPIEPQPSEVQTERPAPTENVTPTETAPASGDLATFTP
jgi:LysM repeat protein